MNLKPIYRYAASARVVCALRRKRFVGAIQQFKCADFQPENVVAIDTDLIAKHFRVQVVSPSENCVREEHECPGQADCDVKAQQVCAVAECLLQDGLRRLAVLHHGDIPERHAPVQTNRAQST